MKILWFTNTPSLYQQNSHLYNGRGWIESLENLIKKRGDIELAISFFHDNDNEKIKKDGTLYYPVKKLSAKNNLIQHVYKNYFGKMENQKKFLLIFGKIIEDFKPDLIHVFGTEGLFASVQGLTTVPVIKSASDETKKATKLATSSGLANLPKAVNFLTVTFKSSGNFSVRGVSTKPGAIALTVTPNLPTSFAKALVKPMTPALAAA